MLTEEQLLEIEARCKAATPGPWEYDGMHNEIQCPQSEDSYWLIVSESRSAPDQAQKQTNSFFDANYAFIAAARSDVPALVAEVRRLCDALSELEVRYAMEKMNRFALRVANKENE